MTYKQAYPNYIIAALLKITYLSVMELSLYMFECILQKLTSFSKILLNQAFAIKVEKVKSEQADLNFDF